MKILIIEDDIQISRQLSEHLENCGFVTQIASDGEEGHYWGEVEDYDVVLLDLGLPQLDGITLLERWRHSGKTFPVIILSARTNKMETIRGLEAGADDYIYKPFDLDEVVARIRANIRRDKGKSDKLFQCQNVALDMNGRRVLLNGAHVKLTRIEYLIVQYLFLHQGTLVSVADLGDHVYENFDHDSSILARHIANIRKKIGSDIILTESNRGYYVPKDNS